MLAYEQQDYLQAAIAHLPPVRQKVIQLKLIHGFTNKEIALHLSIGVKTVEDADPAECCISCIRLQGLLYQCPEDKEDGV